MAFLGPESQYEDDPPGPGPLPWDETWEDPDAGQTLEASLAEASPGSDAEDGWYRVGVHLVHRRSNADFGWQGADLKVDDAGGWTVEKAWHVRPRV